MKKLNLGCGAQTPKNWINVDYSIGAKLSKIPFLNTIVIMKLKWNKNIFIHNLKTTFPWDNNTVDVIYSSHVLEHFTREDGYYFLKECYRVLKPDGIFRLVVPDLRYLVNEYLRGNLRADYFVESLGVLYPNQDNILKKIIAQLTYFPHKCMYDSKTLLQIMLEIGIHSSERMVFESEIKDINDIEIYDRTQYSIIIEGRKYNSSIK